MQAAKNLESRVIETRLVKWKEFEYIQQENFKDLSKDAKDRLKSSILLNNFAQPFYAWKDDYNQGIVYCLDGKHRTIVLEELIKEGVDVPEELPATFIRCENIQEAARLVLIYSSIYAKVAEEGLFDFVKLYDLNWEELKTEIDLPEFDELNMDAIFREGNTDSLHQPPVDKVTLSDRFIVPPFSILDTRQGYWQDRKKKWSELFDSQETRKHFDIISQSGQSTAIYELRNKMRDALGRDPEWDEIIEEAKKRGLHVFEGASVFDPVLAEILYKWFAFPGATVLDPFAGGSVRGIVAGKCGLKYIGIDLRPDQVETNRKQWAAINSEELGTSFVIWQAGDSNVVLDDHSQDLSSDFVFSCPPYHDLEQYSDDPDDLSNMHYDKFKEVYTSIITKSVAKLNDNRFACFVVSEIRDKAGWYKGFVQDTINAFEAAGAKLYNEIVLINVAGSLPIRINRQFQGFRKVGKTHQNVLVFYKGDIKMIPEVFPEIEVLEENSEPNAVEGVEQL